MEKPYLKIKRLHKGIVLPSKRDEDAGYDLYGDIKENYFILKQGEIKLFSTGISMEFPKDWVFYIAERSSTGTKGISRRCGVVDSGYRGEIKIPINNTSNKIILFYKNEEELDKIIEENNLKKEEITTYHLVKAIAQGMLLYSPHVEIEEVDELGRSIREKGGFGSTNK